MPDDPRAHDPGTVADLCAAHHNRPDELLEILHALQHSHGWLREADLVEVARCLNISRAEIHGVVSFYHDFRTAPAGRRILSVCRAEACQSLDGEALAAHAERRLGVGFGGTTRDGSVTLLPTYCLGNCALAPAVMLDGALHGRVTPDRLDSLLAGHDPDLD